MRHYYKSKDMTSLLSLKKDLTVDNYPDYTQQMIDQYIEITEEEYLALEESL